MSQITYQQLFQDFTSREDKLGQIIRYSNYPEKLYPTDLNLHQHQVAAMVREVGSYLSGIGINFNFMKAIIMAYIHDDHEPFMTLGDVQSANEVHLTKKQKGLIRSDEIQAIRKAIYCYPKEVGEHFYANLLIESAHTVKTPESQLVKLCDKIVGLGEALHEIYSGNKTFLVRPVDRTYEKEVPNPIEYYRIYFSRIKEHLPLLEEIFQRVADPQFAFLYEPIPEELPMSHYHLWRKAIKGHAPDWECERLQLKA